MFVFFVTRSLRQKPRVAGGQINYREEEKRILDSILGRDVYDNRIRPSGLNGTGMTTTRLKPTKILIFFGLFPDAATIIVVNLYIRSFAKIDDVKMVSKPSSENSTAPRRRKCISFLQIYCHFPAA